MIFVCPAAFGLVVLQWGFPAGNTWSRRAGGAGHTFFFTLCVGAACAVRVEAMHHPLVVVQSPSMAVPPTDHRTMHRGTGTFHYLWRDGSFYMQRLLCEQINMTGPREYYLRSALMHYVSGPVCRNSQAALLFALREVVK